VEKTGRRFHRFEATRKRQSSSETMFVLDETLLESAKNKTTIASWLLSNCADTKSFRNEFAKRLEECGIKIKIYGGCGNETLEFYDRKKEASKAKFYMAFENSICSDYVTEKVYKYHNKDIIPVVYSGGK
jgi:hypothetical protein